MQLLWELHPVMQWMEDWATGSFGRHSAPVLHLPDRLAKNEVWVLMQAGYPNRRGYTPVHDWAAVRVVDGKAEVHSRRELMERIDFRKALINAGETLPLEHLEKLLPICVDAVRNHVEEKKKRYEGETRPKLEQQLLELDNLREKQLGLFDELPGAVDETLLTRTQKKELDRIQTIENTFQNAKDYVHEVYELGREPFIQVVAVFCGDLTEERRDADRSSVNEAPTLDTLF